MAISTEQLNDLCWYLASQEHACHVVATLVFTLSSLSMNMVELEDTPVVNTTSIASATEHCDGFANNDLVTSDGRLHLLPEFDL